MGITGDFCGLYLVANLIVLLRQILPSVRVNCCHHDPDENACLGAAVFTKVGSIVLEVVHLLKLYSIDVDLFHKAIIIFMDCRYRESEKII